MFRLTTFRRLTQRIPRFVASERGNVAILFGLSVIPIMCFLGAAIDYGRAARARAAMQSALDNTALMISKDLSSDTITPADVNAKAQVYFKALYKDTEALGVTITATYSPPTSTSASVIKFTGSGHVKTDFMQLAGFQSLPFNTSNATSWGNAKMRVALVLDNTGSMASASKLTTLKSVTAGDGGLIDQLSQLAKDDGDVLISLVPFAKVVNVAGGSINPSAIQAAGWTQEPTDVPIPSNWGSVGPGSPCPWNSPSAYICVDENTRQDLNNLTGTAKNKIAASGKICPALRNQGSGDPFTCYAGCWGTTGVSGNYAHIWDPFPLSCIADRDPYLNNADTPAKPNPSDSNTLFPMFVTTTNDSTANCPPNGSAPMQRVKPLTSDWSSLKAAINGMVATGNTDQGIGLQVGVQTLIAGGAFNAPEETNTESTAYTRAIILLSDGWNTQDRWPSDGQMDAHQAALCKAINSATDANGQQMYTVYTIQVDTDHEGVSQVLQKCATTSSQAYYLTSANQMVQTFQQIGQSLGKLRLTN